MAYYAGVDLGATNCRAVVAGDGEPRGREERPTPRGPNGAAVADAVLETLRGACAAAGVAPTGVEAVGIGSIGPLDLAAGTVERPANLPDRIETIPLVGPIGELAGLDAHDVYLYNDTDAGVIGERFHAAESPDDMVYLTISSGIGAGVTVDGHVLRGWDGNAGEVGHTVVDPRGRRTCGCGHDGHWEAYCSGANLPHYARLLAAEAGGVDTALAPAGEESGDGLDAADVFARAREGEEFAEHVVERVARLNAIGVANVVHAYAPLVVAVGGAVALENPELVVEPIRERLPGLVMANVPEVRPTALGADAVLRGALAGALTGGTGDPADRPER
jgi:glucokinase